MVASPVKNKSGKVIAVVNLMEDITKRQLLEDRRRRYEFIINTTKDFMTLINRDYIIEAANQAYCNAHNKNVEDVVNHSLLDVWGKEKFESVIKNLVDKSLNGNIVNYHEWFEFGSLGKRYMDVSYLPYKNLEGIVTHVVIISHDITQTSTLENEILRIKKFESIGKLASGIAHDFNNVLTAILGNASYAKMLVKPEDKLYKILNNLEKASIRGSDLSKQLIGFSKGQTPIKKTMHIKNFLIENMDFLAKGTNVKAEINLPESLWPVFIDKNQISQVFNNLVINARDAMPNGGNLTLYGLNVEIKDNSFYPLLPGKYVKISLKDTGYGISKERLKMIFDPYFTTKKKGNGLGLSISYSIIKQHEGFITADSQVGKGTTFHIYLPASDKKNPDRSEERVNHLIHKGTGKILLMEVNEIVRHSLMMMLNNLGYKTEIAQNSQEAIEIFRNSIRAEDCFDLVILDLTIPGELGAVDTLARIKSQNANIKSILTTGYHNDPIVDEYVNYGFNAILLKPYNIRDLSSALHRIFNT